MAREDYVGKFVVIVLTYNDVRLGCRDLSLEEITIEHLCASRKDIEYASGAVLMDKSGRSKLIKMRASPASVQDTVFMGRPESFKALEVDLQPYGGLYPLLTNDPES